MLVGVPPEVLLISDGRHVLITLQSLTYLNGPMCDNMHLRDFTPPGTPVLTLIPLLPKVGSVVIFFFLTFLYHLVLGYKFLQCRVVCSSPLYLK